MRFPREQFSWIAGAATLLERVLTMVSEEVAQAIIGCQGRRAELLLQNGVR